VEQFRHIRSGLEDVRSALDDQYGLAVDKINSIAKGVSELNAQIVQAERGGIYRNSAGSLRDERDALLKQLSELTNAKVLEQAGGADVVLIGGHALVTENSYYDLRVETVDSRGIGVKKAVFNVDNSDLNAEGGQIHGYAMSRDEMVPDQIDKLDKLVSQFVAEFNKIHSQGVGLNNFSSVEGTEAVSDPGASLLSAGLALTPKNGSFVIRVRDKTTGAVQSVRVPVQLDGVGADDSLNTLLASINTELSAVTSDVTASVTAGNKLRLVSGSENVDFSFGEDSSDVLAALGINTFFSGSNSRNVAVNRVLADDASLVAAALDPAAGDGTNAGKLFDLKTQALDGLDGQSCDDYYQNMIGELGVESGLAKSRSDGANSYLQTLETQRQATSGVSLDEEAMNLMEYQRAYQAAARLVTTIDEMLKVLLEM
jgi:flagellar hook-associated protein 1 FlgK